VRESLKALPEPPFLVPAAAEALLNDTRYGTRTAVVPGEADAFCAAKALDLGSSVVESNQSPEKDLMKSKSATSTEAVQAENSRCTDTVYVFTSDSDLLVHDLGSSGRILFLNTLDIPRLHMTRMEARVADPTEIANRLGLSRLDALAFIISQGGNEPLHAAIEAARSLQKGEYSNQSQRQEFDLFLAEYAHRPNFADPLTSAAVQHDLLGVSGAQVKSLWAALRMLDNRISEFIQQILFLRSNPPPKDAGQKLTVYLPPLIDDPTRSTAWRTSQHIRYLAYSVMASLVPAPITVQEASRRGGAESVARTHGRIAGLDDCIQMITKLSETTESLLDLKDLGLNSNTSSQGSPHGRVWLHRGVALCNLLEGMQLNEMPLPNANDLVRALIRPPPGSGGWDGVHLCAQVCGTIYSIRMLRQIGEVYLALAPVGPHQDERNMYPRLGELFEKMGKTPRIGEVMPVWGTDTDSWGNPSELEEVRSREIIKAVKKLLNIELDWAKRQEVGEGKKRKRRKKNDKSKNQKESVAHTRSGAPSSSNSFAALDMEQ
jgi:hypothetical protein